MRRITFLFLCDLAVLGATRGSLQLLLFQMFRSMQALQEGDFLCILHLFLHCELQGAFQGHWYSRNSMSHRGILGYKRNVP